NLFHAKALLVLISFRVGVPHEGDTARAVEVDSIRHAAEQHRSALLHHDLGELHRQDARTTLDEAASGLEVPALRQSKEGPGEMAGIVGVVAEIGGDRELRRLVVAKMTLENLRRRSAPVLNEAARLQQSA